MPGTRFGLAEKKIVTHAVPSGVRYSHAKNFIGAGCVVDPVALRKEIEDELEASVLKYKRKSASWLK